MIVRPARLDEPVVETLVGEVQQEYVVRYGGADGSPVDPDDFAPPTGAFLLASVDGEPAAIGGFRRCDSRSVEVKRLYVRPAYRRSGLSRAVMQRLEELAAGMGYERMVLSTGTEQPEAVALYRSIGFTDAPPWGYFAGDPRAVFLAKDLPGARGGRGGAGGGGGVGVPHCALVLAGGSARRLGGAAKPAVSVAGRTLLDRTLDACAGADGVAVVGPEVATERAVAWCRENPPGGGPLAGVAAGLRALAAPPEGPGVVLVLGCDMPHVSLAVPALLATLEGTGCDAALALDGDGRVQPLAGAYRRPAVDEALASLGDPYGVPLRRLLERLRVCEVRVPGDATYDCDTWDDVARARTILAGSVRDPARPTGSDRAGSDGGSTGMDEWAREVMAALGLDADTTPLDVETVLEVARDAAHAVARPAAPVTTYLIGYAAALRGTPDGSLRELADAIGALARVRAETSSDSDER